MHAGTQLNNLLQIPQPGERTRTYPGRLPPIIIKVACAVIGGGLQFYACNAATSNAATHMHAELQMQMQMQMQMQERALAIPY